MSLSFRGGPILCPRHPLPDVFKLDFPLTRFPRPWPNLGTPITGAPSMICKHCGGLVALETTYQKCLSCGRGEDVGGSDREVALQDLIHKDLRPRFCYFRKAKPRTKAITFRP